MTTPSTILELLAGQIGVAEHPPGSNRNPYAAELDEAGVPPGHSNGSPWCARLPAWAFHRAGATDALRGALMFTTRDDAQVFKDAGAWFAEPQVGDLAYHYSAELGRISHVGTVESFNDATVTTIEGNTSETAAGSQDNGGVVARRVRARSWWVGYGRPDWFAIPPTIEEEPMELLRPEGTYNIILRGNGQAQHLADPAQVQALIADRLISNIAPEDAKNYDRRARVISRASAQALVPGIVLSDRSDGQR